MGTAIRAAILGAGESSRMGSVTDFKPLLEIDGSSILLRIVNGLIACRMDHITLALNPAGEHQLEKMPFLKKERVSHFFIETPSSMHTLWEVYSRGALGQATHLLVVMADTVLNQRDLEGFVGFVSNLSVKQSAIMVTPFVDDEKPLFVEVDSLNKTVGFGDPSSGFVSSGVYCFTSDTLDPLKDCIDGGMHRLRNFLSYLLKEGHTLSAFRVEKTVDVDRPEDILVAKRLMEEWV